MGLGKKERDGGRKRRVRREEGRDRMRQRGGKPGRKRRVGGKEGRNKEGKKEGRMERKKERITIWVEQGSWVGITDSIWLLRL